MARVTIEDCEKVIKNRFLLVALAAERVKQFDHGAKPVIECKDKPCVAALKEIACNAIDVVKLKDLAISEFQNYSVDDEEEETEDTYDPAFLFETAADADDGTTSVENAIDFSYIVQEEADDV